MQKYFSTREELLAASFHHVSAELKEFLDARLKEPARARDRLRNYVIAHFEWAQSHRDSLMTMLAFFGSAAAHPTLLAINTTTNEVGRERIRSLLLDVALNEGTDGTDPAGLAASVQHVQLTIMGGVLYAWTDTTVPTAEVCHRVWESIERRLTRRS